MSTEPPKTYFDLNVQKERAEQLHAKVNISKFRQLLLSVYWFSSSMMWASVLLITMPLQVKQAVGDESKGTTLGVILAGGAFLSLIAAPVFGALSDRIKLPGGKRKPWVVIGTFGTIVGLMGMGYLIKPNSTESIPFWAASYMIVIIFNNVAIAPYTALLPDIVPKEQRGSAAGFMGIMTVLGNFAGGVTGLYVEAIGIEKVYWIISIVLAAGCIVTMVGVVEIRQEFAVKTEALKEFLKGLVKPFEDRDFVWVFLTRMLVILGVSIINSFMQYYFEDVVKDFTFAGIGNIAHSAEQATSIFVPATLVGAILTTFAAGKISDIYGRKVVIYGSCFLMSIVVFILIFTHEFTFAIIAGGIFGLGFGAFTSVDFALVSDILPSEDDNAKDMGVFHVADTLPQVLAGLFGGIILDQFQKIGKNTNIANLGYIVLFSCSFLSFAFGCFFVSRIKRVK